MAAKGAALVLLFASAWCKHEQALKQSHSSPIIDVTGKSPHDVKHIISKVESSKDGWWTRLGNNVFSPTFTPSADRDISNYYLFTEATPSGLPTELEKYAVLSVPGYHLLHSPKQAPVLQTQDKTVKDTLQPLTAGTATMIPFTRGGESHKFMGLERRRDEKIVGMVNEITPSNYLEQVTAIVESGVEEVDGMKKYKRRRGTAGHEKTVEYLLKTLGAIPGVGIENVGIIYDEPGSLSDLERDENDNVLKNVAGCLPGTEPGEFLLMGGHYDSLPDNVDDSESPGAMDDATGVAAAVKALTVLSKHTYKKTICAVLFDGEEDGCLGSQVVASKIKGGANNLKDKFKGALISDMATGFKRKALHKTMGEAAAGFSKDGQDKPYLVQRSKSLERTYDLEEGARIGVRAPPSSQGQVEQMEKDDDEEVVEDFLHVDSDTSNAQLVKDVAETADLYVDKSIGIYTSTRQVWNTDHSSFTAEGLPACDVCTANHRKYVFWHDSRDTVDNLDGFLGAGTTQTMVANAARLAEIVDKGSRGDDHPLKPLMQKNK